MVVISIVAYILASASLLIAALAVVEDAKQRGEF